MTGRIAVPTSRPTDMDFEAPSLSLEGQRRVEGQAATEQLWCSTESWVR